MSFRQDCRPERAGSVLGRNRHPDPKHTTAFRLTDSIAFPSQVAPNDSQATAICENKRGRMICQLTAKTVALSTFEVARENPGTSLQRVPSPQVPRCAQSLTPVAMSTKNQSQAPRANTHVYRSPVILKADFPEVFDVLCKKEIKTILCVLSLWATPE